MDRIPCPHCGFMNFSISAYCGRCERPLPRPVTTSAAPPEAMAGPVTVTPEPTPVPSRPVLFDQPPPLRLHTPSDAPAAVPRVAAPSPLTSVPAPLPPLSLTSPPPALQPIELDGSIAKPKHPRGPDIGDLPIDPDAEVPVEVPTTVRLMLGRLIDTVIVLGVAMLVFFLETTLTHTSFKTANSGALDRIAEWLSLHSDIVLHAGLAGALFAIIYSVLAAVRSGQTLGRRLTNTVLVRRDGQPFTALRLVVRTVVGLISAACLGAGFFWALLDPYHRTWHDLVAGTVTVRRYVRVRADT